MGKHSPTTPQAKRTARTRARVVALHKAGKPVKVIAARLGMSPQNVRVHLYAAGNDAGAKRRSLERTNRERFAATWNAAADLGERGGCAWAIGDVRPLPGGFAPQPVRGELTWEWALLFLLVVLPATVLEMAKVLWPRRS